MTDTAGIPMTKTVASVSFVEAEIDVATLAGYA
jgi:hypothetical protein